MRRLEGCDQDLCTAPTLTLFFFPKLLIFQVNVLSFEYKVGFFLTPELVTIKRQSKVEGELL